MSTRAAPSLGYRAAALVAGLTVIAVLLLAVLVLVRPTTWFPGAADCTVSVGDRTVELTTAEAERAASAVARSVRRDTSTGLAEQLDAPAADRRLVVDALTGRAPAALSCRHGGAEEAGADGLDGAGLTDRAAKVRTELRAGFGRQELGGFAPGGVTSGHMAGSAHYDGRALDVFFRPADERNLMRGWAVAQYLVAHAERLAVTTVIYDGRIWTARRSGEGWREYAVDTAGRSSAVAAVLEHRDHVHVDVAD